MKEIFDALENAGVKELFIEYINLSSYIKRRLLEEMKETEPAILEKFYSSQSKDYREELNGIIRTLLANYHFTLRMSGVLYHQDINKEI